MTDPKSELKSLAKEVRASISWLELSHGHTLELLVSLLTEEQSWNQFSSSESPIVIPTTLLDAFNVVSRSQRRLETLENTSDHSSIARARRWYTVMDVLSVVSCGDPDSRMLIAKLLDSCDLKNYSTPMTINSEGKMVPLSVQEDPGSFIFNLGSWFFALGEYTYGNYPWDKTEQKALELGFTSSQASLIRATQREAPNHSWPIDLWYEVGVLDSDQGAFLKQLQLDPNWETHFSKLLENDGHYS